MIIIMKNNIDNNKNKMIEKIIKIMKQEHPSKVKVIAMLIAV